MVLDPRELLKPFSKEARASNAAPLAGTAADRSQRIQIGLIGLASMILVVALADIVLSQADETEATVAVDTPPVLAQDDPPAPRDPLADAGVVPELPAEEPEIENLEQHTKGSGNGSRPSLATPQ